MLREDQVPGALETKTPWWRSDRLLDTLDAIFVKRRCGWCGTVNGRGEGFQYLSGRFCDAEHHALYEETGAW